MNGAEATLTEIQSVRQKMGEAYHIQRQYRTILDVLATERIGHDAQLLGLEKSIEEAKAETAKLKVHNNFQFVEITKELAFLFFVKRY